VCHCEARIAPGDNACRSADGARLCLLDCREMQPGRELSLDDIALCSIQRWPPEPKHCYIFCWAAAKCGDECARHRLLQKAAFAERNTQNGTAFIYIGIIYVVFCAESESTQQQQQH